MNAVEGGVSPEKVKGEFLQFKTAYDREETREIRRAQDRESLSRFRQYRTDENCWATQKRTGERRREWRGPWRETKRTN